MQKFANKLLLGSRITYIEPAIRLIVAACVTMISMGFFFFSGYNAIWLGMALFLVIGLLGSGLTQFCLMAWSLRHLGFRSEWDELKMLERAHAAAKTRASYLDTINLLSEVIVEMTPDGSLLWKSDKWLDLFGKDDSPDFYQYINSEDVAVFNDMVEALMEHRESQAKMHFHGTAMDGSRSWLEGRFTLAHDSEGDVVLRGVLRDITDVYEENLTTEHKATHDDLTGLPNRLLFNDRLEMTKALADRKQSLFAVFFIDLDHFKQVNDQMGHHIGDQVLVSVATALSEGIRASDTVARWGGDEFVALIPDLKSADFARVIAEGLLKAASSKLQGKAAEIVTLSIGVAIYPTDSENIGDLLLKADQALYLAKSSGRNNVQFASSIGTTLHQ